MNQRELRGKLEAMLGDLAGVYMPDADVRESTVEWLVRVAQSAAFGSPVERLERERCVSALTAIEKVVREPLRLWAKVYRGRSQARAPEHDFFVELGIGDQILAVGASPILSLAIMHASRSLAARADS